MPEAIPIEQLNSAVYEAVRQAVNALVRLNKTGKVTMSMEDKEFSFQFRVATPGGINAIERTQRTVEGAVTKTATSSKSASATDAGSQDREVVDATERGSNSNTQSQTFGRTNTTDIYYEQ